jgi:hypothetical protein
MFCHEWWDTFFKASSSSPSKITSPKIETFMGKSSIVGAFSSHVWVTLLSLSVPFSWPLYKSPRSSRRFFNPKNSAQFPAEHLKSTTNIPQTATDDDHLPWPSKFFHRWSKIETNGLGWNHQLEYGFRLVRLPIFMGIYYCKIDCICMYIYIWCIFISIYLSYSSIYLYIYLSTYLSTYLSIYLSIYPSIYLSS